MNLQDMISEWSLSSEERELVCQGTAIVDHRWDWEITTAAAAAIELFRLFPPDEDGNTAADEYINLCREIDQRNLLQHQNKCSPLLAMQVNIIPVVQPSGMDSNIERNNAKILVRREKMLMGKKREEILLWTKQHQETWQEL